MTREALHKENSMPKIKITEVDNTTGTTLTSTENIVYIPGVAWAGCGPTLYSSVSALEGALGVSTVEKDSDGKEVPVNPTAGLKEDLSFRLARRCLQLGMKVLYQGFAVARDGKFDIDSDSWEALKDKTLYDVRFLTTGGYACPDSNMVACAESRGDCVALIDVPSDASSAAYIRALFDGKKDEKNASTSAYGTYGIFKSKYAACFAPWFSGSLGSDGTEGIPGCFGYLFSYARSIQSNPMWYAVAGTFRGSISELSDVKIKFSNADVEMLQARAKTGEVGLDDSGDNVGCAINPIAYVRGYGYLIWGNRTLLENSSGTTASSFLNVRNLCSEIKKTMWAAARKYTFEQNSTTLWLNFKHQITPLLDRMVSGNGIESYTFERVSTTAKARLAARLSIVPIEGVEDFELNVYLEDSLEVVEG